MTLSTFIEPRLKESELDTLLADLRETSNERRSESRYALFVPVKLRPTAAMDQTYTAVTKDISLSGIGLLHTSALRQDETFEVEIRTANVEIVRTARLIWTSQVTDSLFLSGCQFV